MVARKGKGRKWVTFGVAVKDGRDWMTAAKNVGMWHRGIERGAEALDNAWRRADLRQSNVWRQHEVSDECDFVLFCLVAVVSICFLPAIYHGEAGMGPAPVSIFGQLTPRDASLCVCLPHSFSRFDCCPLFPSPSFLFRCVAHSISLSLLSYLGCLTLLICSVAC